MYVSRPAVSTQPPAWASVTAAPDSIVASNLTHAIASRSTCEMELREGGEGGDSARSVRA